MTTVDQGMFAGDVKRRRRRSDYFGRACAALTWSGIVLLVVLITHVLLQGISWLDLDFLNNPPSRHPEKAGLMPAIWGTLWMIGLTATFSIPIGVAAAVYLEEYSTPSRFTRLIELNISNLAGVPSIVYGILGLAIFVRWIGFGRSLIAGSLTMSLLILPVVIIASREAIRAVPNSLRLAALGIGATRWQTTLHHVLPAALPGILTGVILAISRAIGETAPLIMIGALTYVAFAPTGPGDSFTVLPIQIYNWASRPQPEFHGLAAAGILVLLAVLLATNLAAVMIRHRAHKKP